MAEPSTLRVKRKATEGAPDVLVLEPRSKRAATALHYVRKPDQSGTNGIQAPKEQDGESNVPAKQQIIESSIKRTYHLTPSKREWAGKSEDENIATFVEKKPYKGSKHESSSSFESRPDSEDGGVIVPLKRPGQRAAVSDTKKLLQHAETDEDRKQMEELAAFMQQTELETIKENRDRWAAGDAAKRTVPMSKRLVTPPKLSGRRSRQIHRERTASKANGSTTGVPTNGDVNMEDGSDSNEYVYDTYFLAQNTDTFSNQQGLTSIGYLIIREEDEPLWSTYLLDPSGDGDDGADTDGEFDENAEDFYGADYPEDELDSDDEFDKKDYAYRTTSAFDEEYDEDTGAWSDDEENFEDRLDHVGFGREAMKGSRLEGVK